MHPTLLSLGHWLGEVDRFLRRFDDLLDTGPRGGSTRRAARVYAAGLLLPGERKSMQPLADGLDGGEVHRLQHFITHSTWDPGAVVERLVDVMPASLRSPSGLLILDATSFPKQGTHSVGVARQYCGSLGKVANCQVAVSCLYSVPDDRNPDALHWPVGMELYLPRGWVADPARRRGAGIPEAVGFQEKWRLALALLDRARHHGLPHLAVVADRDFGDAGGFREALRRLDEPYALGVNPSGLRTIPADVPLVLPPPSGRGRPPSRPRPLRPSGGGPRRPWPGPFPPRPGGG
jgi:SRSO17 transposase